MTDFIVVELSPQIRREAISFFCENRSKNEFKDMDFTSLMQQSQKLANEIQSNDGLPRVERSMPQILKATNELHSRVCESSAQDIQA